MPPAKTVLAALGAMAVLAAPAAAAPPGTTLLVDRPAGFGALPFDGNNETEVGPHAISRDERFVVVTSEADALTSLDENAAGHIFRIDRVTGRVEQADTTAQGGQPTVGSESGEASISADGRFVAFQSTSRNLVAAAPRTGIYVKDMQTGAIVLAGRGTGADGAPAPLVVHAVISGDGRHVAFTAAGPVHAVNADGVDGQTDAYVRDLDAATTRMASVSNQGAEAGGVTGAAPDIDFAGDAVAFVTTTRLDADDGLTDRDAYVRTGIGTAAETTRLASIFTNQVSGHATSADEVALSGSATNLRVAWTAIETYMTSMIAGAAVPPATRMDVARPGGTDAGETEHPVFEPVGSAGERAARLDFLDAGALDPADTNGRRDAYSVPVANPGSPATLLTSGKGAAPVDAAGGAGGAVVAFTSLAADLPGGDGDHEQAYVRAGGRDVNLVGPTASDAGPALIDPRAVSDDGRVVVFSTQAPALGSPFLDDVHLQEVVARDTASGATTLLSATPSGAPADDDATGASVDAAGDRAAFVSRATNLAPGGNPAGRRHAFVRDLGAGQATLVDRAANGTPLAQGIQRVEISPDGRHAVYVSSSPDAPGAPADGLAHAYVVDLASGSTVLVDRATDGAVANGSVQAVDVDGDGSRVAFRSDATNLGAGGLQAYVRDLTAQRTTWVSVPASGLAQDSAVGALSIDRAGNRVAFEQLKPAFGFGMTAVEQIFVRDVTGATPDLASRGPDDPADAEATGPSLSADGKRLTFVTAATNFPAAVPGRGQVYLRDLVARSTTPVSGRARLGAEAASLSGNGACVAFRSSSDDLVTPGYGPDFSHVFLRAVSADCPPARPATSGAGGAAAGEGTAGASSGTGATSATAAGGPTTAARDTTPPRISRAHLTRRRFAVAALRTALAARAHRGTSIAFTLSEDARTTIAITRKRRGRTVTLITLSRATTRAGVNRVAFSGRTRRTRLKPGAYQARLSARDRAGNPSKPVSLTFVVVRP